MTDACQKIFFFANFAPSLCSLRLNFINVLRYNPIIQNINSKLFSEKRINVSVLRLDLIHSQISGNKWFKLKNNLEEAKRLRIDTILTFGGAFSNHIHATAAACKEFGFKSIGVIRGEKESENNFTLNDAKNFGMNLHFVSRESYRKKNESDFIEALRKIFGNFYLVPEGGHNYLGSLGCADILNGIENFDYVFCSCGTTATFSGLAKSIKSGQSLIGISALKGEGNLVEVAQEMINKIRAKEDFKICGTSELMNGDFIKESGIINTYHFGGFAKHTDELLKFKNDFEKENQIPLDYIYEAKLMYAVTDLISKNKIPDGSAIIVIHGGGLQGNKGYEERYSLKPNLNVNDIQG